MNYEELLKKYILYVYQCEGVDFLDMYRGYFGDVEFTREEFEALQSMRCRESIEFKPSINQHFTR